MPEREELNELALILAKDAAAKIVRITGIDAVCITLAGSAEIPLGIILTHPKKTDAMTRIKAIKALSDHIDVLARSIMEEEHGRSRQDGPEVGGPQRSQRQPDAGGRQATDEDQRHDKVPKAGVGKPDPDPAG